MNFKNKGKLKATLLSAAAIATSLLIGMTSACSSSASDGDDEEETTQTKLDTQVLKNGNFEFYNDNDGIYPIAIPESWTSGSSGETSSSMGGVIDTSKKGWDYLTDPSLPQKLEDNDDLDSDDENKLDYNGALSDDMLYKNPHAALESDEDEDPKAYIDNPFTHRYAYNEDGQVVDAEGNEVTVYENEEDGKLYLDEELTEPLETSVLMLHNYRSGYYTGTETYYASSTTLTMQAGTASAVSLWVKTSNLYFDGSAGKRTEVEAERGAYIKVDTSVGGNSLDSFVIKNINTEQLNPDGENNGWVRFTVYVQASSFAETTMTLTLGLGQDDVYTVEGYAFFDDIEYTTYENAAEMEEAVNQGNGEDYFANLVANSTALPLSPDGKSEFRVDKVTFKTEGEGGLSTDYVNPYNSADRDFYLDLAGSTVESSIALNSSSVAAGLTVEKTTTGRYVSSKNTPGTRSGVTTLDNGAANAYLPSNFTSIKTDSDILATVAVTASDVDDWTFPLATDYNAILTKALASAAKLPGVQDDSTTALVMLSANGAAYEAEISDGSFTLGAGKYALVSFWIKTADMNGNTAATVTVRDVDDEDNYSNFSLDSTDIDPVTINEKEDVYDGWVQCFVRVENLSEDQDKSFTVSVNFGNTAIKSTAQTSYKAGWVAVTNLSFMELDEDVYAYTSGVSHSASLTLQDSDSSASNFFDSEQGDKNVIKSDLAIPSSYTGVNGGSAEVVNLGTEATEYDETNNNAFAGLLNKENLSAYKEGCEWYSAIAALARLDAGATDDEIWNAIAGKYSVQPLLIVNTVRSFKDMEEKIYNYGYYGGNSSVSADSYVAVSVRVKVSEGAIATVYLVDTDAKSKQVLSYEIPAYTFWYDDDGNILKGEPQENASVADQKANVAYTLRSDGLYENGDGKLYANFYNLEKYYDVRFEHENFYDENGNLVSYENLVQGETYYANAEKTAYAPHHLIAGSASDKIYLYAGEGLGTQAVYYYMVDGVADESKVVYGVDTAVAPLRYDNTQTVSTPYQFTIDATTPEGAAKYADQWVTVTFYLHAGSETKNYRLELWSGERDKLTSGQTEGSHVIFDYSQISLDESTYTELLGYYTDKIIGEYQKNIDEPLEDNDASIAEYEKLAGVKSDIFNYEAKYYTFTLYDSPSYVPFNADTANDDETGYAYSYSDYSESLAYLRVEDTDVEAHGGEYAMAAFIDYSVVEKSIAIGTAAESVEDEEEVTTSSDSTNLWLLIASIALVVAIIIAILAIVIRDLIKKIRRKKTAGKNSYNFNKNKRYVKKYVKANGEAPVSVEEGDVDQSLLSDQTTASDGDSASTQATEGNETQSTEENETQATEGNETQDDGAQTPEEQKKPDGKGTDGAN